jgi:hypothetical protein
MDMTLEQKKKAGADDTPKTLAAKVMGVIVGVGAVAAALAIVPTFDAVRGFIVQHWDRYGSEELPASYAGEIWKRATVSDFEWLEDDWCYPSLPGFRTRFRVQDGTLARQNEGTKPERFATDWVKAEAFVSNRGVLRLRYESGDWPGTYIDREGNKTAEWREGERYARDDGTVTSGNKRLVLSCRRCRLSQDGMTYKCEGP